MRATSAGLNCGQGVNGFLRMGSPPRMAGLDMMGYQVLSLNILALRLTRFIRPDWALIAFDTGELEGLAKP